MAGTWAGARAAIKGHLDGITISRQAGQTETLKAFEYAQNGRQDAGNWPYCFIMPSPPEVMRGPNRVLYQERDITVRVMIAPNSRTDEMGTLQQRYDLWIDALIAAFNDAVALDGNADHLGNPQTFTGLANYDDLDAGWGFEMGLGAMRVSQTVVFTA